MTLPTPSSTNPRDQKESILIVEDSPTQRALLLYSLEETLRYKVIAENNAKQALEILKTQTPTLIISDVMMPEMDGYEFCRRVKSDACLRNIPVVLLTSLNDREDLVRALECGADSFIAKPFDVPYLLAQIERIIVNRRVPTIDSDDEIELWLGTKQFRIAARKRQILDMLLSAYEAAIKKNSELAASQRALKQLNEELEVKVRDRTAKLQETNTSLEAFCYTIAHDLRAPLRAIHGLISLLIEDKEPLFDEAARDYAKRIWSSAERMDRLILDLLTFGKISQADIKKEQVDLETTLEQVLTGLEHEAKSSQANISVFCSVNAIQSNRALIEQILQNLISNALKFRSGQRQPSVEVRIENDADNLVRISVKDNGIGIDPAFHDRIFKIFERVHSNESVPGTGIGLAIVQKAVSKLGGRIEVESQKNEGSKFTVFLPRS